MAGGNRAPTLGLLVVALVVGLGATLGTAAPGSADEAGREHAPRRAQRAADTTVVVHADDLGGRAATKLLGANHHYNANGYGLWDEARDRPEPRAVEATLRAGVQSVRFPGGTIANLYDWKRGIGSTHRCQVSGNPSPQGYRIIGDRLGFGTDEYFRFLDATHAEPFIMVPFVTETPGDAADWVEYLNSPSGTSSNPRGGVDWAELRAANGHPAPYGVRRFEIGNEQHHRGSRYWLSRNDATAVRQYAFGGSKDVKRELAGVGCRHPRGGSTTNGKAGQTFDVLYPPLVPESVEVSIAGKDWRRGDPSKAKSTDRVFSVGPGGEISFGDGTHGAVPPAGEKVRVAYRSVHRGFFAFARAMKEVDPGIDVCSSWGTPQFPAVVRDRDYDCLTAHPISAFKGAAGSWSGPLEGHDRMMMAADDRRATMRRLQASLPHGVPLWLSEFSVVNGDTASYPHWNSSASQATYMATLWASWLKLGIPWGTGDDLLWARRGVLGPPPGFTDTADAVTRAAIAPMFEAGGRLADVAVKGNPVRRAADARGSYDGVTTAATRSDGTVYVLVVNRMPTKAVDTRVLVRGAGTADTADVVSVHGSSFTDWNQPGHAPTVTAHRSTETATDGAVRLDLPPASTTLVELRLR